MKCCVCGSEKIYCSNISDDMCFCKNCIGKVKGHYGFLSGKELKTYIESKKWWQIWK